MERLTIKDVHLDEHTTRRTIIDANKVRECAMEIYWALKEYEDAEEAGVLVRLPCAVGATIYTVEDTVESYVENGKRNWWPTRISAEAHVEEHIVDGFDLRADEIFGPGDTDAVELMPIWGEDGEWYPTREEAEAALRKFKKEKEKKDGEENEDYAQ